MNRRKFIASTAAIGLTAPFASGAAKGPSSKTEQRLLEAADSLKLNLKGLSSPIIIESMELLREGETYFVRTRSSDGHVGISVTNKKVTTLYPIFLQLIAPFFIGKDARELEVLLNKVYVHKSNYKMQSLALWCCVAWAEMSILDMLGRARGVHISDLFGGKVRDKVPIYVASGNRETTPAEEIEVLKKSIARTGARAVKFKVGGRMSFNADSLPKRSEELIALSRKMLGDEVTIQADANGSYDVEHAIEFGKRLQDINAYLFEEPCRFDHIDETKRVADALTIPVSGGEQESSEYRFRQMLAQDVIQIAQPDLHYYGGFIRTARVGRMAEAVGAPITVHISNRNAGYAEMVNFSSFAPNMGRFQELKSGMEATSELFEPRIVAKDGYLNVPTAPGLGMAHAEEHLKNAEHIKES